MSRIIANLVRKIQVVIFVKMIRMNDPTVMNDDPEDLSELSDELYERMTIRVDKGQEPLRIDKFLTTRIQHASRNKIQQCIEAGRVLVNTKIVQSNYKIRPLDEIIIYSEKPGVGEEIIP